MKLCRPTCTTLDKQSTSIHAYKKASPGVRPLGHFLLSSPKSSHMPSVQGIRLRQELSRLIPEDASLADDLENTITQHPSLAPLFRRLIDQFKAKISRIDTDRPVKRVKMEHQTTIETKSSTKPDTTVNITTNTVGLTDDPLQLSLKDVSFVTPIRKKLTLLISRSSISATQSTDDQSAEIDLPAVDVRAIIVLPVPEKAAKQFNFCLFRKSSDETVVFTVPDTVVKNATGPQASYDSYYRTLLSRTFEQITQVSVIQPNEQDFTSAIPQPHRKHEPAVHVIAHRGPKEGFLFFLPTGLVYCFKRPILYINLQDITSVTYNDILQRTFNLTVTIELEGKIEAVEFSMIDAVEHDRIDRYIRKYQLNDQSLAESRKAKVSTIKGNEENESQISKAAQEIAASITADAVAGSDEEDGDFEDDQSHGGSTLASDESDIEEDESGNSE